MSSRSAKVDLPGNPAVSRTLGDVLDELLPRIRGRHEIPYWPPDVFAASATLLQACDAYRSTVNRWPPAGRKQWVKEVQRLAASWRRDLDRGIERVPRAIRGAWTKITKASRTPIDAIGEELPLTNAMLLLMATSDECCRQVGFIRSRSAPLTGFERECFTLLDRRPASLCRDISSTRAIVLPKVHTPPTGLTIRSMSHHLALVRSGEVSPLWQVIRPASFEKVAETNVLKLLLMPLPSVVRPTAFEEVLPPRLRNMPAEFGFFRANTPGVGVEFVRTCLDIHAAAVRETGPVDALVFPECALGPGVSEELCRKTKTVVIAGVGGAHRGKQVNRLELAIPDKSGTPILFEQAKHHRWRMSGSQVVQYGLSARLNPAREWWEDFEIEPRKLLFWNPLEWLTVNVLICEDLARPDPGADIVRAVGPNLVIALLLDGPQLAQRWSGRYATVLADDPGSSVLTLTSAGMARLCRPEGRDPSNVIGLWKDPRSGVRELALPEGHDALVLVLTRQGGHEWTADGRADSGLTDLVLWGGVHAIPSVRGKKPASGST